MYKLTTNTHYSNVIIYKLTGPVFYKSTGVTFLCILTGDAVLSFCGTDRPPDAPVCNNEILYLSDKDVILIQPDQYYNFRSETSAVVLELIFDYIFFKDTFSNDYKRLTCNSILDKKHDYLTLRKFLGKIAIVHYSDISENQFYLLSDIFELFHYLKTEYIDACTKNEKYTDKKQQKVNNIISYIGKNYNNSISLQDLAKYMNFTPQYLEKFMKQTLNSTFYDYLKQIRLDSALDFLNYTAQSLNFIASICGFPSVSAFKNLFSSKYGISPVQYRENRLSKAVPCNSKEDAKITDSLAKDFLTNMIQINNYSNSLIENSITITTSVNTAKSRPISPTWKEQINLGICNNLEKPIFRAHLTALQSELNFKYGRIQNILDLIDTYQSENGVTYNLTKIYRITDFLRSIRMYPFFELGNKSFSIYKDLSGKLPSGKSVDEYFFKITELLPVFLVNCINRYSYQEVSNWKFELWTEHNGFMTIIENPADYVKRFSYVYKTIKKYLPEAEVGAPGFNTFIPIEHLEALFKEFNRTHLIPDFISFYLYPYIRPSGSIFSEDGSLIILLSKDKNIFKKQIDQIRQLVNKYFGSKTELYATEYSSAVYSHNYINDSAYQAAFIIKETLDNCASLNTLSYWLISDISIEYENAVDILFGGNGLISRDGIKKPSFYAFSFLGSLGTHLIAKEENYIVTSSSNRNFQILAYNYCYFNEEYCDDQDKYKSLNYPASAFETIPAIHLTIQLKEIPPGTYTIRQHIIDQEHGNVLYTWFRLNSPRDLTEKDIEYLKNISVPDFKIYPKEVTDLLEISCHLNGNNIILTEIDLLI